MPRFSIITVCFNAAQSLPETAASLRRQTWTDYEWLVVDGGSSDGTVAAARSAGVEQARISSEPDAGIYDAMNKGIAQARGDWIYFLNAGDAFADTAVLQDLASAADRHPEARLIYGDMIYATPAGDRIRRFEHIARRMLVFEDLNHQAVFAHHSLFDTVGRFDLRFRTSADYDWLLRVFRAGTVTRHLPRMIARFEVGGSHSRNIAALASERLALRLQYVSPAVLWLGDRLARVRRRWRIWRGRDE